MSEEVESRSHKSTSVMRRFIICAGVLLFVFCLESPGSARGRNPGVYRGRQGRRVGRVTLPTPPFNPDAGVLDNRGGRGHKPPKTRRHRSTRRSVKPAGHGTPHGRRVRRKHQPRHGTPRVTGVNHQSSNSSKRTAAGSLHDSEPGQGSTLRFTIPSGTE